MNLKLFFFLYYFDVPSLGSFHESKSSFDNEIVCIEYSNCPQVHYKRKCRVIRKKWKAEKLQFVESCFSSWVLSNTWKQPFKLKCNQPKFHFSRDFQYFYISIFRHGLTSPKQLRARKMERGLPTTSERQRRKTLQLAGLSMSIRYAAIYNFEFFLIFSCIEKSCFSFCLSCFVFGMLCCNQRLSFLSIRQLVC